MAELDSTKPSDEWASWGIGCVSETDGPQGKRISQFTFQRELSEAELQAINDATGLLMELVMNPYNQFLEHVAAFGDALEAAYRSSATRPNELLDLLRKADFEGRVSAILGAFYMFLGHTDRELGRRYGRKSSQLAAYREARAKEEANSRAFRLLYYLRGRGQHQQRIVHTNVSERLSDAGTKVRVVTIAISDRVLEDALADGRTDAAMKKVIRDLDRPALFSPFILELRDSVARIFASRLLAQEEDLRRAIDEVRARAAEIPCEGRSVLMRYTGAVEADVPTVKDLTTRRFCVEEAGAVESAIETSRKLLGSQSA